MNCRVNMRETDDGPTADIPFVLYGKIFLDGYVTVLLNILY